MIKNKIKKILLALPQGTYALLLLLLIAAVVVFVLALAVRLAWSI